MEALHSTCNRGLKSLGGFRAPALPLRSVAMRDRETTDSELRLLAAVRRTAKEVGTPAPRIDLADELLDEWLFYEARARSAAGSYSVGS
jgi:hypothetical protein